MQLTRYNGKYKNKTLYRNGSSFHGSRIYLYINFVPREYFYGLLNFRKPTLKLSASRAHAQSVSLEREGQHLSHQGVMSWEKQPETAQSGYSKRRIFSHLLRVYAFYNILSIV